MYNIYIYTYFSFAHSFVSFMYINIHIYIYTHTHEHMQIHMCVYTRSKGRFDDFFHPNFCYHETCKIFLARSRRGLLFVSGFVLDKLVRRVSPRQLHYIVPFLPTRLALHRSTLILPQKIQKRQIHTQCMHLVGLQAFLLINFGVGPAPKTASCGKPVQKQHRSVRRLS